MSHTRLSRLAFLLVSPALAFSQVQGVKGIVEDDRSQPITVAEIVIESKSDRMRSLTVTSGANGQFRMIGLNPGTYTVAIRKTGFEPAIREIRVHSGATFDLGRLVLRRIGSEADTPPQLLQQVQPSRDPDPARSAAVDLPPLVAPAQVDQRQRLLRVTDTTGAVIELWNAKIDYTSYSFIYTLDIESRGMRAHQGSGLLTIDWSRIETVTIIRKRTDTLPHRLAAEVVLSDKTRQPIELAIDSKLGLHGDTSVGQFSIPLERIRSIFVVPNVESGMGQVSRITACPLAALSAGSAFLVVGFSHDQEGGTVSTDIDGIVLRKFEGNKIIDSLHYLSEKNGCVVYQRSIPRPVAFYLTVLDEAFSDEIAIGGFITRRQPLEMLTIDRAAYVFTVPKNTRAFFVGAYNFRREAGAATTMEMAVIATWNTTGRYRLDVGVEEESYRRIAADVKTSWALDLVMFEGGSLVQIR